MICLFSKGWQGMSKISYIRTPWGSAHAQSIWCVSYTGVVLPVTSRGGLNQEKNGLNKIKQGQYVPLYPTVLYFVSGK